MRKTTTGTPTSEVGESDPAPERELTDAELHAWWNRIVELESQLPGVLTGPEPEPGPRCPAPARARGSRAPAPQADKKS